MYALLIQALFCLYVFNIFSNAQVLERLIDKAKTIPFHCLGNIVPPFPTNPVYTKHMDILTNCNCPFYWKTTGITALSNMQTPIFYSSR